MGIRNAIRSLKEGGPPVTGKPLVITEAAVEEIRRRLEAEDGEDLAFFVVTQPSPLGFNVGVGLERVEEGPDHPRREEFDVPVRVSDEDWERMAGFTIDVRDGRFVTSSDVTVHVSETPNPRSRKFILNRRLVEEGSATFTRPAGDEDPLLVKLLFEIPQVKMLFFVNDFVSVTREPDTEWNDFMTEVGRRLQAYFAHGGAPLVPPPPDPTRYSDVERRIVEVLEDVVRPAVQRDGGDIAFVGYEEGTVELFMLGSCVGCPSSMATLKMGVENLLKDSVPEVREVVAIE